MNEVFKKIFEPNKGILAADESDGTIKKRFENLGIESTKENIEKFREILFTSPKINKFISGVILYKDTLNQMIGDKSVPEYLSSKKILYGLKVDEGLEDYKNGSGLKINKEVDDLFKKIILAKDKGISFTKWRAVFPVKCEDEEFMKKSLENLAEYSHIVESVDILPILEPEILLDDDFTIDECKKQLLKVLRILFDQISLKSSNPNKCILKTSFVCSGLKAEKREKAKVVAQKTFEVLNECGRWFGGIVFLSGGLDKKDSFSYLKETIKIAKKEKFKLPITFSYSRALQNDPMEFWSQNQDKVSKTQKIFINNAEEVSNF